MYLYLLLNYSIGLVFLLVSLVICVALFLLTYLFSRKERSFKKTVAYECGFDSFSDQLNFDIHFYIVALLFLIFDVEIVFLYPWSICFYFLNTIGVFSMFLFLIIIVIGYVYEWKKGALNWTWK